MCNKISRRLLSYEHKGFINVRSRNKAKRFSNELDYISLKVELNGTRVMKQEEETIDYQPDNVAAYLFSSSDNAISSIDDILDSTTNETLVSSPYQHYYGYGEEDDEERSSLLVRTAMKSKERDEEERWVVFSEVVEDMSSSSISYGGRRGKEVDEKPLDLKLDYDRILNAWSNKGSLFVARNSSRMVPRIHVDSSRTVPEIQADDTDVQQNEYEDLITVPKNEDLIAVPRNESVIMVPRNESVITVPRNEDVITVPKNEDVIMVPKMGSEYQAKGKNEDREASVLRYKEKRHNRLFSKRIRYQVRKLNAEKRPRNKGRFVKTNSGDCS